MPGRVLHVRAHALRLPRDGASSRGTAGSPASPGEHAGRYRWASTYRTLYSEQLETVLVKVETDDGHVGWGEAQAPVAPEITREAIDSLLAWGVIASARVRHPTRAIDAIARREVEQLRADLELDAMHGAGAGRLAG